MTQLILATQSQLKALNQPLDDVINGLLANMHKATTRSTYRLNLKYFAYYLLTGLFDKGKRINLSDSQVKGIIGEFLALEKKKAISYVAEYQSSLINAGYSPNSINIKIASVKAVVKYAYDYELCLFTLDKIKSLTLMFTEILVVHPKKVIV